MTTMLALLALLTAPAIDQDCKDDCVSEYQDEIERCPRTYDEPDDTDDVIRCIGSAKEDYRSCLDDCRNQ